MKARILTYHQRVTVPHVLADKLPGLILKQVNSQYYPRQDHLLINWGSTDSTLIFQDGLAPGRLLNHPAQVGRAIDKLSFFQAASQAKVPIPKFTTDKAEARKWLNNNRTVVCRRTTTGFGGRGIVVVEPGSVLPDAPLYVRYVPKSAEYRIHVMLKEVLDVQQKKHLQGQAPKSYKIRSYDNGWIFARKGVVAPKEVLDAALAAVEACGLDFGAVDIGWSEKAQKATVYEVNSAPALEGTTLKKYVAAFKKLMR